VTDPTSLGSVDVPADWEKLCLRVPGTRRRATLDDTLACVLPRGHDNDGFDGDQEPNCIFGNAPMVAQAGEKP
jgi:hypothetical protein